VLAEFHRDDLPFVPHITLDSFGEEEHYRHALYEAEQLGFEYTSLLDRLHLVKVNSERSHIVWSKSFFCELFTWMRSVPPAVAGGSTLTMRYGIGG